MNKSKGKFNIQGIENIGRLKQLESWLADHVNQLAMLILVSGFFVYFFYGTRYYLNPDEAFNLFVANQLTGLTVWKALLTSAGYDPAHPPLFVFVLHLFMKFWNSVLALRFLSAAFSLSALWYAFKWIQRTYGSIEAFVGLILLEFSPAMVSISYVLRDYPMLLFFICGALYFFIVFPR